MAKQTSKTSLPQGVRIRNGKIQIYFSKHKKQYAVTLPHPANAEGIKTAVKIRNELITKAEWGILTDDDIAQAKGIAIEDDTVIVDDGILFQEVAQKYLLHNTANTHTKKEYLKALEYHWMPNLALIPIHKITTEYLRDVIAERNFTNDKTLNNCLIPLRGVFEKAMEMQIIDSNPIDPIKNKKIQVGLPDPFTREEMNALLEWLDNNLTDDNHFYYWYFEVAFWTGCRPSELLALRWSDIDYFNDLVLINKSRVRGEEKKVTKTRTVREVCLNERSKKAFQEIQKLKLSNDYVMICPNTNEPFFNERPFRKRLTKAMQECQIRHRPAYNARHTYATMLLMDGINPMFVANQMGHSLQMLMKRYAKWINGDKSKMEMAKLNIN